MVQIVHGIEADLVRENNLLKRENANLDAKLEYVAMMADVELPEIEEDEVYENEPEI